MAHGTACTLHQKRQENSRTLIGVLVGAGELCVDCSCQCECVISQVLVQALEGNMDSAWNEHCVMQVSGVCACVCACADVL